MGTLIDMKEGAVRHHLDVILESVDEVISQTLSEDLSECILVAENSLCLLFSLNSKDGVLKAIRRNIDMAKEKTESVEDRHRVIQIALDQINQQFWRATTKEVRNPNGSLCSLDVTKAFVPLFKLSESRQS